MKNKSYNSFIGLLCGIALIDRLGRKGTMAIGFLLYAVVCFLHFICISGFVGELFYANFFVHGNNECFSSTLTFMLFLARALAAAAFQVVYVYTPEVCVMMCRPTRLLPMLIIKGVPD